MPKLQDIIAAFLADLTRAQDEINELSAKLSQKYKEGEILKYFPVPNGLLTEAEAEFRFVILENQLELPRPVKVPKLAGPVRPAASQVRMLQSEVAGLLSDAVAEALSRQNRTEAGLEGLSEESRQIATRIADLSQALRSPAVRKQIAAHLESPCLEALRTKPTHPKRLEQRVEADATALAQAFSASLVSGLDKEFPNPDQKQWVSEQLDQALSGNRREVAALITAHLNQSAKDAAELAEPDSLAVSTDNVVIANCEEWQVHRLKLKAKLRNYKWVIVKDDEKADELMPED